MKISYQWLQSYFIKKLPAPEALAERLALGFAEVESVEKNGNDVVFDIKVLPDRACYALSHRGVAKEVSALTGLQTREEEALSFPISRGVRKIAVRMEEPTLCPRYTARVVDNVSVGPSPKWLRERLEAIGERSINNIVDATNFTMFDIGQPLHAFDADKVRGGIVVRKARDCDTLVTLDGKTLSLGKDALVIADDEGLLALAGVKGGKRAEVTAETKAIILEAASFDATLVRRTSQLYGVRTESSRRFENNLTPWFAGEGSAACAALIQKLCQSARVGSPADIFPKKKKPKTIRVSRDFLCTSLGMDVNDKTILAALKALCLAVKKKGKTLAVTPPPERRDLTLPEDIVEEVGRVIGYSQIPENKLPLLSIEPTPNKQTQIEDAVRDLLTAEGFSEVLTSSFAAQGEVAIEKPLAADKAFCRPDLWTNFHAALLKNFSNAPLLETETVRQFEIGRVFTAKGEGRALIIGSLPAKQIVLEVLVKLEQVLGRKLSGKFCGGENIYECFI